MRLGFLHNSWRTVTPRGLLMDSYISEIAHAKNMRFACSMTIVTLNSQSSRGMAVGSSSSPVLGQDPELYGNMKLYSPCSHFRVVHTIVC